MSHIYPVEGQKHFELRQELTDLGGKEKETFRFAVAWDGEHFMEITDDTSGTELYEKWIELHGGAGDEHGGSETATPDEPSTDDSAETSDAVTDETLGNKLDSSQDETAQNPDRPAAEEDKRSTDENTAEPPGQPSQEDEPAAAEAPDASDTESDSDDFTADTEAEAKSSGTTRKRSAKNSTRRS